MASNLRQEEVWIDISNDLYDLVEKQPQLIFISSDWHQMSFDRALELVQDEAYSGFKTTWEDTYFTGKPAIRFIRSDVT